MAQSGYGPPLLSFETLGNLGNTFWQAEERARKQALEEQTRALLGQAAQTGDYSKVGNALVGLGRVQEGAALIGLGQKAADRDADAKILQSIFGGSSGGTPAPSSASPGAAPTSLIQNESGGNWQAQNNAVGAGGQRGHFGRLQFGQARLQEAAAAGAIPQGTTPQAFMASPELQQRAEAWHFNDIDQFIRGNGLDKTIGRSINGVPVTLDGMRAVAHLGGKEGLAKFIASGGRYNPSDANGTSLMDYFSRHGGGGQPTQVAAPVTPVQQAPLSPPGVQVAESEADVQRLEAEMAARQAAPVQMAQAPAQPGQPIADLPPQGGSASLNQFVIPGSGQVVDPQTLASNPRIQNMVRALGLVKSDQARAAINKQLEIELADIKQQQSQSAPTDAVRNYRFYRQEEQAAGRQPMSFQEFRKSTVPQTNVNLPVQEKEYDKQAAKDYAEMNRDLIKGAQSANQKIATLNRLETLLSDPSVRTGAGAQLALQAARLGKSVFGIETEGLGPAEAINAIANQFALELRNPSGGAGMPGALSDRDREFLQQSTPGLERDPNGNKLIIDYMRRVNQRSVDVERLRREYVREHKRLDEGFFDKLAEFSEKNPLFPEATAAPKGPVSIKTTADYDKLKSGDQFLDPDGNLRTKR